MRTKALILTAALTAAGIGQSLAQVYSANAVGYVNLSIPPGFTIVANPLNGTNNELNTVLQLPDVAIGANLYRWDSTGMQFNSLLWLGAAGGGWLDFSGTASAPLNPGEGAFLENLTGSPFNVTFVGEVPQGALSLPLAGNFVFSIISSVVPQALPLGEPGQAGTLEFNGVAGDNVYLYDNATGGYQSWLFFGTGAGWFNAQTGGVDMGPTIAPGTGFWLQSAGPDRSWDRNFSVN